MRRTAALIASVGLLAALTACATPSANSADCDAPFSAGSGSETVSATGDFGSVPDVEVPTPLHVSTSQVSTLIAGTGAPIEKGQLVDVDYTLLNGSTGEVLEATTYDGSSPAQIVAGGNAITGLADGLLCAKVDSRIAITIAPEDGLGASNAASLGIAADDTLVVVVDITKALLARADGEPQIPENGFPNVVLAEDGTPGISKPSGDAPTKLEIDTLKQGDGATVQEGDSVVVNYSGWLWSDGTIFDSSWQNGQPVPLTAADGTTTQGGVVPGFAKALIGAKVGSQVIAIIPPDQGYGDTATGSIPAGSTLVFVVDVLGINN